MTVFGGLALLSVSGIEPCASLDQIRLTVPADTASCQERRLLSRLEAKAMRAQVEKMKMWERGWEAMRRELPQIITA